MFHCWAPRPTSRVRLAVGFAALLSLSAGPATTGHAQAVSVPGVFATGLSDSGSLLEANARDPHWDLTASPDAAYPGPATWVVQDGFPIPPWIANGPESRWIGPRADAGSGAAAGNYTYTTRFSLADFDPTTAVLTGRWSSDNSGVDILLNGVSQSLANDGGFGGFTPQFEIRSGFVDGLNTLAFVVNNAGDSANPTGFRAELALVAEPAAGPGTPPTISSQPADLSVGPGETATFGVGVRGGRPLRFQWRFNGFPLSRATNATYTVPSMSEAWIGGYSVVVLNDWGSITSRVASLSLGFRSEATRRIEPPGPSSRRTGITFSEIHYHPVDRQDGRNLEFIELYNSNPFPEDLGSWRLTGEWDVTLPPGTVLPARSHLVIAADPAALRELHGVTNVMGGPTAQLSNGGGTLRLRKPSGAVVLDVNYGDSAPWPKAADGFGPSLVLARPTLGEGEPEAWRPSTRSGGSPGTHDPDPAPAYDGLLLNEVLSHPSSGQTAFVEVFNAAPFARDLSGCLVQAGTNPVARFPAGTTIPARGWRQMAVPTWNLALNRTALILWDPTQASAIDSIELTGQASGIPAGRSPDGSSSWAALTSPTPAVANDPRSLPNVVLNEIHYHPPSDNPADEFVEILNRGSDVADLSGWQLSHAITYTFPNGTLLSPGHTLAIAADAARLRAGNPRTPAALILGNFSGNLADGGESLVLSRPVTQTVTLEGRPFTNLIQVPVEVVPYRDGGRWSRWADGGGSSLERLDPRADASQPDSWGGSDESSRGGWTLVEATGPADLTHPSVPAADQLQILLLGEGEALVDDVEVIAGGRSVLANGGFESGLAGWVPQGTHRASAITDVGARSGTRALRLIASDRGDHVANRIRKPLTQSVANGTTVTLRARVRWLRGNPEILLRLRNGALEATGRLEQPPHVGSPGLSNPTARANNGPVIATVRHDPILPAANQAIRVIARIADPDGVGAAEIQYRRDPETALATVAMRDDGAEGDERAGDGEFTGRIPGQPAATLVAFRILTRDAASPSRTNVYPSATAASPAPECLVRFGEPAGPGSIGTYRLWMTAATIQRWASREIMSNEGLDITFVHGTNRVIYNAAAKYSGSSYTAGIYNSPVGNLCGYDIAIPDDDPFLGGNRVLLDWPIRDDTYLREQLMFWFLERLGLPNMYRRHVHLYVNGQRRGAVYEDIQQPGSDTVQEWFSGDDQGSLWKTDCWNEFDDAGSRLDPCILNTLQIFTSGGQKKAARYRWNWRPRAVRGSANDFSDLFALVDALNVPTQNLPASADALVDVDHWMRTFAMNDLASFWDAFGNPNGKNTFLYKPERGRWALMSWDFDVGLGVFNDPPDAPLFDCNDPIVSRLYQSPPLVRRYWTAIDESLNGFFQTGPATDLDRFLDQRRMALQAAGTNPGSVDAIKSWITQRRAYLNSQVARHRASFAIRSNNGNDFTTADSILSLTGTAPVRVASLRLNGIDWPAQWTTTTNWTLRLGLRPGNNRLEVTGVDRSGQPVPGATDFIQVVSTGAEPPVASIRINEWLASNNAAVQDPADGDFDDWFELFNTGDIPVDLTGYTLTDDLTRPARQTIPSGFVLQPRTALLVWADGQPEQTRSGQTLHVNFQLNRGGSDIALFDTLGRRVDAIRYTSQTTDIAEGRWGDGAEGPFFRFTQPSPGSTNTLPAPGAIRLTLEGRLDPTNDDLELGWIAYTNRTYRIEAQSALGPFWESLEPDIRASSTNTAVRIRPDPTDPNRFYRLRLLP